MELPDAALVVKLAGLDAGPIVLDSAAAAAVVDGDVYFGGTGVEGIGEQATSYGFEGGNDDRGLDLVDNVAGEWADGHSMSCGIGMDGLHPSRDALNPSMKTLCACQVAIRQAVSWSWSVEVRWNRRSTVKEPGTRS